MRAEKGRRMDFEMELTPKEKYERLVPLLIAGAGYSKDDENKIVREALADFLAGKTESPAIAACEEYSAKGAQLKASAKAECGVEE